jgi:hypothetical protein
MARRSLCIQAHAVSYEPNPRTRCRPRAETPFFCEVTNQTAANQVLSGVRVRSKIVPAVTDVRREHALHIHNPAPVRQYSAPPHFGQTNPSGQRSLARYSKQASSVLNHSWNCPKVLGSTDVFLDVELLQLCGHVAAGVSGIHRAFGLYEES